MPRVRLEPGFVSYSASVSACEKAALWQLALELLAQLPRVGLEPDAVRCSTAISACGNAAQWLLVLPLPTCLPRIGLEPDTVSYAAAVSACEKAARRGFSDLPQAVGAGPMPGVANGAERVGAGSHQIAAGIMASHATTSACWPKRRLSDVATQVLLAMQNEQVECDMTHYNAAISACKKCRV
mmetsp:Transcript_79488/g.257452  ORF Transcript_79488/g.257452 Transcript_79488/m.257452 type:complete len:183 (-) Transcript_79488:35-583(-)